MKMVFNKSIFSYWSVCLCSMEEYGMNKISKHVPRVINILFVFLLFGSIFFEHTEQMFIYHLWIIWIFCNTFLSAIIVLKDWKSFSAGKRILSSILIAWWFIGLLIAYKLPMLLFDLHSMLLYIIVLIFLSFGAMYSNK